MDESTQIFDQGGIVTSADLIPGAKELIDTLKDTGYQLALVADGLTRSFRNILTQHNLWDKFDCHIISEEVGYEKPHRAMFLAAAAALGITDNDFPSVVMVGNNLKRDIKGANALGMVSIFLSWTPRYSNIPADSSEVPDYTIAYPLDLLPLLKRLEGHASDKGA